MTKEAMNSGSGTIFALSSGRGPAAIAVIRISGPQAGHALKALTGKIPEPRQAAFARVRNPRTQEIVDEALALWFPGPNSETGEDTAELQLHGGRAVIAATLEALGRIEGLRPAEAGEFTRRAFENGKLDLTAVEGLADLVMAETEGQRRQAFRQMKGLLSERAEGWRQRLIQALALVEARIDFSEEDDVLEKDVTGKALAHARALESEIASVLADQGRGERLREGVVVAIAGPPNAGKSTLLNRLARREAAIVSPYAGTTRDVIEVHLDLGGLPVTLVDTAGIRDTGDPVEMEGVRRACERAHSADLVLWVVDAMEPAALVPRRAEAGAAGALGADARSGLSASWALLPAASDFGGSGRVGSAAEAGQRTIHAGGPAIAGDARRAERAAPSNGLSGAPTGIATSAGSRVESGGAAPPTWVIRNKIDLLPRHRRNEPQTQRDRSDEPDFRFNTFLKFMVNSGLARKTESEFYRNEYEFNISATTGEGFDELLLRLAGFAERFLVGAESALVTRVRHRRALEDTLAALRRALAPELGNREDLLAEELHAAAHALGRLTGRVDVEDILDVIFRDFCIGK
jgi:tRNA modification GTPase